MSAEVVGLVPAAGRGKRISPLPCSKELYPVGFYQDANGEDRPKVASHYLIEKFGKAGIAIAYVIVRDGKWDIPSYFGEGHSMGVKLAYIVISDSLGPPDTLDRAYPFVQNKSVAFGFPDIIFGPTDAIARLLRHLRTSGAEAVLGLYPAHDTRTMDMVDVGEDGRVHAMSLKPAFTHLRYSWLCAVWTPALTQFMHEFVAHEVAKGTRDKGGYREIDAQGDLPVGAVLKAAIEHGLRVDGLTFPHETYIDIGTPSSLSEAVRRYTALS